jgi:hypothetical protein
MEPAGAVEGAPRVVIGEAVAREEVELVEEDHEGTEKGEAG